MLTIHPLRARDVQTYHLCEDLTELLLYFMVVFSPWAFGTTEPWSIWTMNLCGYTLGVLLAVKLSIRSLKKYRPQDGKAESRKTGKRETAGGITLPVFTLAVLTLAILSYCTIAAVNAVATFNPTSLTFQYHDYIRWLPHSFESQSTWDSFWTCLSLACSFWAIHDWLQGKSTAKERIAGRGAIFQNPRRVVPSLPPRLHRLLWVMAVSSGLLGLEGIVQRQLDSPRLLFLVRPEIHQSAQEQFASYAYRANGAQYFNLMWPVCLGFWWRMECSQTLGPPAKYLLLVCTAIMAACPLIATARGAALVELGMLLSAASMLLLSMCFGGVRRHRCRKAYSAVLVFLFMAGALGLGLGFGWKQLRPRMADFKEGLDSRREIYERARPIARDYPLFGTGPGTFERVFQLYRGSAQAYWPAQLHNDWLETRITFGWAGFTLIALSLLTICLRWFTPGGIYAGRRFVFLIWLSLAGCLVQARWDFPLQVYSILFLFLVWCAVLFTLSPRPYT